MTLVPRGLGTHLKFQRVSLGHNQDVSQAAHPSVKRRESHRTQNRPVRSGLCPAVPLGSSIGPGRDAPAQRASRLRDQGLSPARTHLARSGALRGHPTASSCQGARGEGRSLPVAGNWPPGPPPLKAASLRLRGLVAVLETRCHFLPQDGQPFHSRKTEHRLLHSPEPRNHQQM